MVTNELQNVEEDKRLTIALGMASQGALMKYDSAVPRTITWNILLKVQPKQNQFTIRSTYDPITDTDSSHAMWKD